MRWPVALAMVAFFAGCGIPPLDLDRAKLVEGPPNADQAETMICESLGVAGDCPKMYFHVPDVERCSVDAFWYDRCGECVSGITGSDGILLVMPQWAAIPSDTAMIHELVHWGRGDTNHGRVAELWGNPGNWPWQVPPGSLVGDLNAALVGAGL